MSRLSRGFGALLPPLLVVAYILMTHVAVALREDRIALSALGLLILLALLAPLRRGAAWAWTVLLLAAVLLSLNGAAPWARIVLFLPPVLVNVGLALIFGHTLARGVQPLVERFINAMHREVVTDPAVLSYARVVTGVWTVVFCLNAVICFVLALLVVPGGLLAIAGSASPFPVQVWVWTLYADAGCYGVVALTFLVEYRVRSNHFPWQPYRNFFDFMRQAMVVGPGVIGGIFQPSQQTEAKGR